MREVLIEYAYYFWEQREHTFVFNIDENTRLRYKFVFGKMSVWDLYRYDKFNDMHNSFIDLSLLTEEEYFQYQLVHDTSVDLDLVRAIQKEFRITEKYYKTAFTLTGNNYETIKY